MTYDSDILIVGGGLNGCTLALALARAGLTSTLIDAQTRDTRGTPGFDGRSYALALASVRMMRALGLWDALAAGAQPMHQIKVSDGRAGDASVFLGLHFDSAEMEEGPMGHMVEDRHLRPALLEAVASETRITQMDGARVAAQDVHPDGVTLTLESGDILRGRLLVAADGRTGPTAARAGISRRVRDYKQTALVCAIAHEAPHNGVAHQLFLPSGPLAILPLTKNRSSIVWTEARGLAEDINALPEADYLTVLRPRFGDFLGEISLAGARYTYPLTLSLAQRMVGERLALVGDAAHGVHPIAGQGLNAGLRDIAALAHVLHHAKRRGEDIANPMVLQRYSQWRGFDVTALATATDTFNRLFSNDNPLIRAGRDAGMAVVNALPGLRRGFMREAAGLTGDLPDLMRG